MLVLKFFTTLILFIGFAYSSQFQTEEIAKAAIRQQILLYFNLKWIPYRPEFDVFENLVHFTKDSKDVKKSELLNRLYETAYNTEADDQFEFLMKLYSPGSAITWALRSSENNINRFNHVIIHAESSLLSASMTKQLLSSANINDTLIDKILHFDEHVETNPMIDINNVTYSNPGDIDPFDLLVFVLHYIKISGKKNHHLIPIAKQLLDGGADIIGLGYPLNLKPLILAVETQSESFALNLYYRGRGMFCRNVLMASFQQAKSKNMIKMAYIFLKDLEDLNYQQQLETEAQTHFDFHSQYRDLLIISMILNDAKAMEFLLENGADINRAYAPSNTIAIVFKDYFTDGAIKKIKLFRKYGAKFPEYQIYSHSLLFLTNLKIQIQFVKDFIDEFHAEFESEVIFQTLGVACDLGRIEIAEKLLNILNERGVLNDFINRPFCFGHTLLTSAVSQNNSGLVKGLLQLEADVNVIDDLNLTPVDTAFLQGHIEMARLLVNNYNAIQQRSGEAYLENNELFYNSTLKKLNLVNEIFNNGFPELFKELTHASIGMKRRNPADPSYWNLTMKDRNQNLNEPGFIPTAVEELYLSGYCPFMRNEHWISRFNFGKFHLIKNGFLINKSH